MITHRRYTPGDVLGEGAQGLVIRVTDREAPHRALVAKVWKRGAFPEGVLEAEFALLARQRIRGLARAHDLARDESNGAPFLVEDFIAGEDLVEHLAHVASSPEEATRRLASVLRDVTCTLAALHAAGFVHGDIKPAHIRIPRAAEGEAATAILIDLGAAIATREHVGTTVALTRAFAAPEVLGGNLPTASSDLYSLGASALAAAKPVSVPPSLRAVLERMTAQHPADRFADAAALLEQLGKLGPELRIQPRANDAYASLVGRESELAELLREGDVPRVRWLSGPAGSGKTHLLREALTRALLAGRTARLIGFPTDDVPSTVKLAAYLRGDAVELPFLPAPSGEELLLFLDGLDEAPRDLVTALEAYACRIHANEATPIVIASTRAARDPGQRELVLGPLSEDGFRALGASLGVTAESELLELERASERWPGWAVAARAGMPIARDAVIARARSLSTHAADVLASIALFCGALPRASAAKLARDADGATRELMSAGLVSRRGEGTLVLTSVELAASIADALGTPKRVTACADVLLSSSEPPVDALIRVAAASSRPHERAALLSLATTRARKLSLHAEETRALLALLEADSERTAPRLLRAERLTRDFGQKQAHLRVGEWLWALANGEPSVLSLALRRRAEKVARSGDYASALHDVDQALAHAERMNDRAATGYALATRGAIHLYAARGADARDALEAARAVLEDVAEPDAEEIARLDHNLGAALLYADQPALAADALMRSLATKRRLSDLGGVRSCLMNLGIAWSKARAWEQADAAFQEATELARLLGQAGGLAWCHVERAELALRRGLTDDATRFADEALAHKSALPAGVAADLSLVRSEIGLARGRADLAEKALLEVSAEIRAEDAAVDARACLITARLALATLPVRSRAAARAAARSMRRARTAHNGELYEKAHGLLSKLRARANHIPSITTPPARTEPMDDTLWEILTRMTLAAPEEAMSLLLTSLSRESQAERAFVVQVSAGGVERVWGMDADGLPLEHPDKRVPRPLVVAAAQGEQTVYERDVENGVGRGARLAVAKGNAVLVLEHRFAPGRFDSLSPQALARWMALIAVAIIMQHHVTEDAPHGHARSIPAELARESSAINDDSTVQPARALRREFPEIRGESDALRRSLSRLDTAIDSDLPVLITGETGAGKELFSRALHELGPRARAPFVAVNCAAIPDNLFEAELFGHAKGAFTGAERARPGLLARAEGGTLLLDEVGELQPARQASLLRVLESRRYRPVGSDDERAFDVRIVAATNRDLSSAVDHGHFRGDLLYRLRVLDIRVPPLRERDGDVPLLAKHFLSVARSKTELTKGALAALSAYGWPGNVRELSHQMQRIAALGIPVCDVAHLSRDIRASAGTGVAPRATRAERTTENEQAEVLRAMELSGGNITHAAARLGLTRHGLKKKMLRLGLRAKLGVQRSG